MWSLTDEYNVYILLFKIKLEVGRLEYEPYYLVFREPFKIQVSVYNDFSIDEDEKVEQINVINTIKSFKLDESVICLNKPPNILFCNCGHISIRVECNEVKPLNICPVCKTNNSIKRMIE